MPIERALFVVAPQDSGKSTQLRAMFLDRRFHTNGEIPLSRNLPDSFYLSNELQLYLRLTSPHEYGESPSEWLAKIQKKTELGRWCHAGALQPNAEKNMPDLIATIDSFFREFTPDRLRIAFLSPTRHGISTKCYSNGVDMIRKLHDHAAEAVCIDARNKEANGLLLSDFFDYC